jgi:hypothetical protein
MDDKELIKKVKNSFKAKKSRAEILKGFQSRGYKLEYAEKLIAKAKRPKRVVACLAITVLLFFSLTFSAYTIFSDNQKLQITNPLSGFTITGAAVASSGHQQPTNQPKTNISLEEIAITPDYISFILNEIGAWQLHKNPLTLENPIINFKIEEQEFYSEINKEIQTKEGLSGKADIQIQTNKEDLVNAIMSSNPQEIFKQSITSGKTQIEIIASEIELGSKGYLSLYDSLS